MEAIAARPDGTNVSFLALPAPIFASAGNLIGGVNMLFDLSHLTGAHRIAINHDTIVDYDDAIIAKDLNRTIVKWNGGAQRLFGYSPEEASGPSVAMLAPAGRQDEPTEILERILRNECIERFETIRRRKDGSLVGISLSVSPIKNRKGRIIGAAKIARDITQRRQGEAQKNLLIREIDLRVKNLFPLAKSVVSLSVRSAETASELTSIVSARLRAVARSNALCIRYDHTATQPTTLHILYR